MGMGLLETSWPLLPFEESGFLREKIQTSASIGFVRSEMYVFMPLLVKISKGK